MSVPGSTFRLLSAINGWSLVVVGSLSLLVSLIATAWAGVLISLAAATHGALELFLRNRVFGGDRVQAVRWLALNQLGLAASLSLYFAFQVMVFDDEAVYRALMASPLSEALFLYPEPMRSQLIDSLPFLVGLFYAIAAGVSWLVCGGTAIFYWSQRERS